MAEESNPLSDLMLPFDRRAWSGISILSLLKYQTISVTASDRRKSTSVNDQLVAKGYYLSTYSVLGVLPLTLASAPRRTRLEGRDTATLISHLDNKVLLTSLQIGSLRAAA
jgi:hypothetical protein